MSSAATQPATAPKRRRRWLSFSLRSLLLAMTVLCVWLGLKMNEARQQREAVTAIRSLNGQIKLIRYDYEMTPAPGGGFNVNPNAEPRVPAWLRNIFGDDLFYNVVRVQ